MAASFTNTEKVSLGSIFGYLTEFAADSSYPTGGYAVTAAQFGARKIKGVIPIGTDGGYIYAWDEVNKKIKIYNGGEGAVTPAGSNSAPTYTDGATSGALNLASPLFSGTGYATAGQVVTTTGNTTMTLNQCQGMWLMSDALPTTPPALIVSNTAVTGAPAVLTVVGAAPATDAGTWRIVKNLTVGSVAAPIFTGTAIPAGAADEVANATNLSALTGIPFLILAV